METSSRPSRIRTGAAGSRRPAYASNRAQAFARRAPRAFPFVLGLGLFAGCESPAGGPGAKGAPDPLSDRNTAEIRLTGNLDASRFSIGSILHSQVFLHAARASDPLEAAADSGGGSLSIRAGDRIGMSAVSADGRGAVSSFTVPAGATLSDFCRALTAFLRSPALQAGDAVEAVLLEGTGAAGSRFAIRGNARAIAHLALTSDRSASAERIPLVLDFPDPLPADPAGNGAFARPLLAAARAQDRLDELLDANGTPLGLGAADPVSISGSRGGEPIGAGGPVPFGADATLQDLLDRIRLALVLPETDGTWAENKSVDVASAVGADWKIAGAIVVRGAPGADQEVRDISVRARDADGQRPSPNFFNTNMNFTEVRRAAFGEDHRINALVFDREGTGYSMTLRFLATAKSGFWEWELIPNGSGTFLEGGKGTLTFGPDGKPQTLVTGGGEAALFDPGNGKPIRVILDLGGAGGAPGLTQIAARTTAVQAWQPGWPTSGP